MSAFTETAFLKKLTDLNSSQQSIQTLSLWLIHHRKHSANIVNTWCRELQGAPEAKKLTFMYLANDVIQNSKKKGPEYGKEFGHVLPRVFKHISKTCSSEKLFGNLNRILGIWDERGVYDSKLIEEMKECLNKERKKGESSEPSAQAGAAAAAAASSTSSSSSSQNTQNNHKEKAEKRKHEETKHKSKKHRHNSSDVAVKSPTIAPTAAENGQQSPFTPLGDPPEAEELIKALLAIENSASSDAEMRERIANLPAEISEASHLQKIADKEQAKELQNKVNKAVVMLNDYNARLAHEMEERNKLASMLRNYEAEQKELLEQAEKRLEEYKQKLAKMIALKKNIKDHMSNLPDLKQLPDVTGGLAPLPSAGDLFNH